MKQRIYFIVFFSVMTIMIIVYFLFCKQSNHAKNQQNKERLSIEIEDFTDKKIVVSYLYFQENDSVIYVAQEKERPVYYRYYFNENKRIEIGEISNLYIYTNTTVEKDGWLYFIVSVLEEDGKAKNKLCGIHLSDNTLHDISECDDNSLPGLNIYSYDDKIVTLKNIVNEDNTITTFLDMYDFDLKKWIPGEKKVWRSFNEEGEAFYVFYADEKQLYVIEDEYASKEAKSRRMLSIYNPNDHEKEAIDLSGEILDYTRSGRLIQLSVDDNLLYMKNTSDYGFVAKIENNRFVTMIDKQKYLTKVWVNNHSQNEKNMYYIRRSDKLFFYDAETDSFQDIHIDLKKNESIHVAMVDGNSLFLSCYVQDEKGNPLGKHVYYYHGIIQ